MTELLFLMLKQQNSLLLTKKINKNTAALIEINLYSVLSLYLFIQFLKCSAKYVYCIWK